MRVIGTGLLHEFLAKSDHDGVDDQLKAWFAEARSATWAEQAEVAERYRYATFASANEIMFNFPGTQCQLKARVQYARGILTIMSVGNP